MELFRYCLLRLFFSDESVNTGYDFLIPLIVTENTISVDNVLYSVLKGNTGNAATIKVGTVTTVAPDEDATVTNSGDEHDATFDFEIPQGVTGNGIEKIELLSTAGLVNTYRITMTDETIFDLSVSDGNGIASVALHATTGLVKTYRISFTDGSHFDYDVVNGNGIDKIEKKSTAGLVDTYTITYTDGTTKDYNVTNGKSAYQSYLETTTDDPVKSEAVWAALMGAKEDLSNKKTIGNPASETEYPNWKGMSDVIIPAEFTIAAALNLLNAKIAALEKIISDGVLGNVQVENITTVGNIFYKGSLMILTGTAAPSITPDFIGQTFIDTAAGKTYAAKGITNSGDWKQTSN